MSVPHVQHYKFLDTKQFEQDLHYLENHFRYLTYEEIVESRSTAEKGAGSGVCLTFDDGFAECTSVVGPILLRHRATCIFFVVTDFIDNQAVFFETRASLCVDAVLRHPVDEVETIFADLGLLTKLHVAEETYRNVIPKQMARYWSRFERRVRPMLIWLLMSGPDEAQLVDEICRRLHVDIDGYLKTKTPYLSREQILQLRSDGFTIGAHSRSHGRLQNLPFDQAEREIVESCRIIRDLTGQTSVPFAFPYFGGGFDRLWLARIREQYPFVGLFFDTQGQRRDAPIVVQRMFGERIDEAGSLDRLLRRAWLKRFF
jgi:peptidoglycan/xylan/chitin deacetylase (PgdA/CDA1 family)